MHPAGDEPGIGKSHAIRLVLRGQPIEFVVPEPMLVQRLLGRGRTDDTEAVIRRRLGVYCQGTAPLLHLHHDQLVSLDAVGHVAAITQRVLDALHASTTDI